MKVEIVPIIPTSKLMKIMTMYAVLGTSNRKEAGYIKGVIDNLQKEQVSYQMEILIFFASLTVFNPIRIAH